MAGPKFPRKYIINGRAEFDCTREQIIEYILYMSNHPLTNDGVQQWAEEEFGIELRNDHVTALLQSLKRKNLAVRIRRGMYWHTDRINPPEKEAEYPQV